MGNTAQSPKNKLEQIAEAAATVSPTATSSSNEARVSKVADLYELVSPMVQGVWVGNRSAVARLLISCNSARLLLTAGASTTLEDNQGHCAMDWATAPRNAAVRHILQQHMHAEGQ